MERQPHQVAWAMVASHMRTNVNNKFVHRLEELPVRASSPRLVTELAYGVGPQGVWCSVCPCWPNALVFHFPRT